MRGASEVVDEVRKEKSEEGNKKGKEEERRG